MSTIAAPAASSEARPAVVAPVQPIRRTPSLGPNTPCPCGSGKKLKRCCGDSGAGVPARQGETATSTSVAPPALADKNVRPPENASSPDPRPSPHGGEAAAAAPLWQRLTGQLPGHTLSREARRAGLTRLAAWLESELEQTLRRRDSGAGVRSAELAASPARQGETPTGTSGAPSALAGTEARPTNIPAAPSPVGEAAAVAPIVNRKSTIENAVGAVPSSPGEAAASPVPRPPSHAVPSDPAWEPSLELAEVLGLPETRLNRLMRELDGVSARERWDRIRALVFVEQFYAEIQRMLGGVNLDLGWREVNPGNLFDAMLTALRSARRREGWTRTELAWKHGFRHHGRLNLAVYRRFGVTVQQLEAEIIKEMLKHRKTQSAMCMFRSESDAPDRAPPSFESPGRASPGPESPSPDPDSLPLLPPRIAADPVWAERFRTSGHPLLQPRAFQSAEAALKAFKKEGFTERELDYLIRRGHIPPLEAYVA